MDNSGLTGFGSPPPFFGIDFALIFIRRKLRIEEHLGKVMIVLKSVIEKLHLEVLSGIDRVDRPVEGGYASDLLSCAMQGAKKDFLWVTLQAHMNVVAVASLCNLAGVIITEGKRPSSETIIKAEAEGVVLLLTPQNTFTVVGRLGSLGIGGE